MLQRARHEDVVLDVGAAVVIGLLGVSSLFAAASGDRPADLLGLVLVLVGAGSLVLTRRQPLWVLAVALAATMAVEELDYHQNGAGLTVLWALYAVAARLPRKVSLPAAVATLALVNLSLSTAPDPATAADRITTTVIMGAGWAFGRASRARRSRTALEDRALVAEERAAIAREMQDLVAHELAELSVQVTAARRLATQDPQATQALLTEAEDTARAVVGEGRRILVLLTPAKEAAERRPMPGLPDLTDLVDQHARAGLPVVLRGDTGIGVAAGPGLLAYRAAEEALAEAARARARHAEVCVSDKDGALLLRVRHDGAASGGEGSAGIRRRAELYGGSLVRRTNSGATTVVLSIPAAGTRRTTR